MLEDEGCAAGIFEKHVDREAIPCLCGDRGVVAVDDGGIAQTLHEGQHWAVSPGGRVAPDLQLEDCETSVVRRAEQVHLAQTRV